MNHQFQTGKEKNYQMLLLQTEELLNDEMDVSGKICSLLSIIKSEIGLYWVGLYFNQDQILYLGYFQGLPACTRIPFGKGVCGTSAIQKKTIIVDKVEDFPGYIACHSETKSEIVIPGLVGDEVKFVLDIDSLEYSSFDETDSFYLQKITEKIVSILYK